MPSDRGEERRSLRSAVLLTAELECDGIRVPVRIANISAHGALVSGGVLPPADRRLIFHCKGIAIEGWVAWARPPDAGIDFDAEIDPKIFARKNRPEKLIIRDTRDKDFRRPGFRGNQLSAEERRIVDEWEREQRSSSRPEPGG